ncbi:MAG: tetratricopeptide repeat protein, partial [Candidatus Kapaibacteriales bacterium]
LQIFRRFALIFLALILYAFANITKANNYNLKFAEIKPLNRVTLYFDTLPNNINSQLNENKTLISFSFQNTRAVQTDPLRGEGIINSLEFINRQSQLEVIIKLKAPRGYTYAILPTSQSLLIEVFEWKSLSTAEDNYRMGILALSNNLSVARKHFEKAFKDKLGNAGFFLGMLFLRGNLIESAIQTLLEAEKLNCNIPDIYILLAQAYMFVNENVKSNEYRKKYFELSHQTNINYLEIEPSLKDSIFKEISEDFIFDEESTEKNIATFKDSTQIKTQLSTIDSIHTYNTKEPPIIEKVLLYILLTIGFLSLILFALYLKWKGEKRKLSTIHSFKDELKKQTSGIKVSKTLLDKSYKSPSKTSVPKPPVINSPNKINPDIKTLAEEIIASKQTSLKLSEDSKIEKSKTTSRKIPPKLEISMQIQKEQQELMKTKLKNLEQLPAETDPNTLIEKAKSLGLSKSSIYARQNITAIEKDKSFTQKLFEKFYFQKKK